MEYFYSPLLILLILIVLIILVIIYHTMDDTLPFINSDYSCSDDEKYIEQYNDNNWLSEALSLTDQLDFFANCPKYKRFPAWSYSNKKILAPMQFINRNISFRKLCVMKGCDLVYTDEIIDNSLTNINRIITAPDNNIPDFRLITYIHCNKAVILQTTYDEPLILQLGTSDPITALQAVQYVINDIIAVDINMGCPYSNKGRGGDLLRYKGKYWKDSKAASIVKYLRTTLPTDLPLTCKIRLISKIDNNNEVDIDRTIELIMLLAEYKVSAIAIHARLVGDKQIHTSKSITKSKALYHYMPVILSILKTKNIDIPIIYNGDIFTYEDILKCSKEYSNCNSVMIGRGAMHNCSIFNSLKENIFDLYNQLISLCIHPYNVPINITKIWFRKVLIRLAKRKAIYIAQDNNNEVAIINDINDVLKILFSCNNHEEIKTKVFSTINIM